MEDINYGVAVFSIDSSDVLHLWKTETKDMEDFLNKFSNYVNDHGTTIYTQLCVVTPIEEEDRNTAITLITTLAIESRQDFIESNRGNLDQDNYEKFVMENMVAELTMLSLDDLNSKLKLILTPTESEYEN